MSRSTLLSVLLTFVLCLAGLRASQSDAISAAIMNPVSIVGTESFLGFPAYSPTDDEQDYKGSRETYIRFVKDVMRADMPISQLNMFMSIQMMNTFNPSTQDLIRLIMSMKSFTFNDISFMMSHLKTVRAALLAKGEADAGFMTDLAAPTNPKVLLMSFHVLSGSSKPGPSFDSIFSAIVSPSGKVYELSMVELIQILSA